MKINYIAIYATRQTVLSLFLTLRICMYVCVCDYGKGFGREVETDGLKDITFKSFFSEFEIILNLRMVYLSHILPINQSVIDLNSYSVIHDLYVEESSLWHIEKGMNETA